MNAELRVVGTLFWFKYRFKQKFEFKFCLNVKLNSELAPTALNSAFTLLTSSCFTSANIWKKILNRVVKRWFKEIKDGDFFLEFVNSLEASC